jgi:GAF domain-containing protein
LEQWRAELFQTSERLFARVRELEQNVRRLGETVRTPEQLAVDIIEYTLEVLHASAGIAVRLTGDGRKLELAGAVNLPSELLSSFKRLSLTAPSPFCEAAHSGQGIFLSTREVALARFPTLEPLLAGGGAQALAVVPVRHLGRIEGAMGVLFNEPRAFTMAEQAQLNVLAGRFARVIRKQSWRAPRRRRRAERSRSSLP